MIRNSNLNISSIQSNSVNTKGTRENNNSFEEISTHHIEIIIPKIRIYQRKSNKKNISKSDITLFNKKIKRSNFKYSKRDKIIIKVFNEFKLTVSFNKILRKLKTIEKNINNKFYLSYRDFAMDIRKIFSNMFISISNKLDFSKYNQILILAELFEKIYKKYDCNCLVRKSKTTLQTIKKLKKEIYKNEKKNKANRRKNNKSNKALVKKYKDYISKNIHNLNISQKKEFLTMISNNLIDKNKENNIVIFNINEIPFYKLKELNRYIKQCINNNFIVSEGKEKSNLFKYESIEENKEEEFCKENEHSSVISDDDYNESDLD